MFLQCTVHNNTQGGVAVQDCAALQPNPSDTALPGKEFLKLSELRRLPLSLSPSFLGTLWKINIVQLVFHCLPFLERLSLFCLPARPAAEQACKLPVNPYNLLSVLVLVHLYLAAWEEEHKSLRTTSIARKLCWVKQQRSRVRCRAAGCMLTTIYKEKGKCGTEGSIWSSNLLRQ